LFEEIIMKESEQKFDSKRPRKKYGTILMDFLLTIPPGILLLSVFAGKVAIGEKLEVGISSPQILQK
jgi:hypothetical protein